MPEQLAPDVVLVVVGDECADDFHVVLGRKVEQLTCQKTSRTMQWVIYMNTISNHSII